MDRTHLAPTTPESFFMLPMHSRLEVSQMPIPTGLTPPPPLSLYPSSLFTHDPLPLPLVGHFSQRSGQPSSDRGVCSLGSLALVGQALRAPGEGEVKLSTDEESLLSLVSGGSGWSARGEVRGKIQV